MANKYYNVDKSPYHTNMYFLTADEAVHKAVADCPKTNPFSYQQIIIGLFGLKPSDFFKYIKITYNAKVIKSKGSHWRAIYFENLSDAWTFAKECDRRFAYCVENKFFEVSNAS